MKYFFLPWSYLSLGKAHTHKAALSLQDVEEPGEKQQLLGAHLPPAPAAQPMLFSMARTVPCWSFAFVVTLKLHLLLEQLEAKRRFFFSWELALDSHTDLGVRVV